MTSENNRWFRRVSNLSSLDYNCRVATLCQPAICCFQAVR